MSPQTFSRLLWQVPVLLCIVVLAIPGLAWDSALFGPWPVWLLAAPGVYGAVGWKRSARRAGPRQTPTGAHVLVFPVPAKLAGSAQGAQRYVA